MASEDKFTMIDLKFDGDVAILELANGRSNRLTFEFLEEIHKGLDAVLRNEDIKILVTTADGKYYSNGIDLVALSGGGENAGDEFLDHLGALCCRIMTFPMLTIAAVNGHAFAGGMLIAMSHDYRIMNKDIGWMSMNEVFMPQRLPPFLVELLKTKVPHGIAQLEVVSLGRRFTADDAVQRGLAEASLPQNELIKAAVDLGRDRLKYGDYIRLSIHHFKVDLYRPLLDQLGKVGNVLQMPDDYVQFKVKSKI